VNIGLIGENFKREFCTAAQKSPMRWPQVRGKDGKMT